MCRRPLSRDKGCTATVNDGHRRPPCSTALALYRLDGHEHEVISPTPEADGIALLYSNPQGRGGVCPLYGLFMLLSFQPTPDSSGTSCSAHPQLLRSYSISVHPLAFSPQSILLSVSSASAPLSPSHHSLWMHSVRSTFKDRESCDWSRIDTSASFAMHCTV